MKTRNPISLAVFVLLLTTLVFSQGVASGDLHVTVPIDAGQGGNDVIRGVGLERGVMVRHHCAIVYEEVQQVRHLLEVGRDIRIIPREMDVSSFQAGIWEFPNKRLILKQMRALLKNPEVPM